MKYEGGTLTAVICDINVKKTIGKFNAYRQVFVAFQCFVGRYSLPCSFFDLFILYIAIILDFLKY